MDDMPDFYEDKDDETFIIKKHINIENARKDICFDTLLPYDPNNEEHVSEWAMAIALQNFKIDVTITVEEFTDAVNSAMCLQTLNTMVDKGLLKMSWNGDEPVYSLTEEGKELGQAIQDSEEGK